MNISIRLILAALEINGLEKSQYFYNNLKIILNAIWSFCTNDYDIKIIIITMIIHFTSKQMLK